jgi:hypothetical protein
MGVQVVSSMCWDWCSGGCSHRAGAGTKVALDDTGQSQRTTMSKCVSCAAPAHPAAAATAAAAAVRLRSLTRQTSSWIMSRHGRWTSHSSWCVAGCMTGSSTTAAAPASSLSSSCVAVQAAPCAGSSNCKQLHRTVCHT